MSTDGRVGGGVRLLLQLEGAMVLAVATVLYARTGSSWGLFGILFFTPDVVMLGYVSGPRVGAALYNLGHSYPLPLALWIFGPAAAAPFALIWIGHIGFDRLMGYGLKYATAFQDTHLGRIGRPST